MTKTWQRTTKFDKRGAALADRHYSRRKVGSPQFMPPGETVVLVGADDYPAVFGWWRPHPDSGLKSMNGLDGWTCTIFRNEGARLSSELILEAETFLADKTIGPDGLITYVFDSKVRSTNPGYCFKRAGYKVRGRSKDGKKTLLIKSIDQTGFSEPVLHPARRQQPQGSGCSSAGSLYRGPIRDCRGSGSKRARGHHDAHSNVPRSATAATRSRRTVIRRV